MTTQPVLETETLVGASDLADGRMVRLAGDVGADQLPLLRDILLTPLPAGCRDVVVDAGAITAISDDAVAVLVAAPVWVESQGGRMLVSRSSDALDDVLDELELLDLLPRLGALPQSRSLQSVPPPRRPLD